MTREEAYNACISKLRESNTLLLQATTGFGKSKLAIMLANHLINTAFSNTSVSVLLLVAKRVHKKTWQEEINKWGGINTSQITIECYESLKKHVNKSYGIIIADEVHHIGSDLRLDLLSFIHFDFFFGLSATIPRNLKSYFSYTYHSKVITCSLEEAIKDNILPEPQILLYPISLDNTKYSEEWVLNPKASGETIHANISEIHKYRKMRKRVVLSCTQKQKLNEMNIQILKDKNKYMTSRNKVLEQIWLYHCGKRLEYLSDCKVSAVKAILSRLDSYRTITFCKTIGQSEMLGKNCMHSKNAKATEIYNKFNNKELNHITAVNILNENANLVDCKYAIFNNIPASELVQIQRIGRSLRHESPVIIIPYYEGTREEEIIEKLIEGFNHDYIKTIHSVEEI